MSRKRKAARDAARPRPVAKVRPLDLTPAMTEQHAGTIVAAAFFYPQTRAERRAGSPRKVRHAAT